ncbi:hypothetical protein AWB78_08528 [Caballeronia calidae]|uniref:Uncharacterized protein n=1 Tax=Caballeronia calidae TaxID=1777139 RepID=A0A158EK96_9BURK|nr:hypothetical protein AWB78_08528 [Caballeronia calidae]
MRQGGNRLIETGPTQAANTQISQEGSRAGDPLFGRTRTALANTVQEKRAHALWIPSADIVTKQLEHCRGIARVQSKRRQLRTPMFLHPLTEIADDVGFANLCSANLRRFTDTDPNQVFMKALRSEVNMVAYFTALCIWTVARWKMSMEGFQHPRTYLGKGPANRQHEAAQMISGPNVSYGTGCRISLPFQCISKAVNESTGRSCPQAPQCLWCYQVCV